MSMWSAPVLFVYRVSIPLPSRVYWWVAPLKFVPEISLLRINLVSIFAKVPDRSFGSHICKLQHLLNLRVIFLTAAIFFSLPTKWKNNAADKIGINIPISEFEALTWKHFPHNWFLCTGNPPLTGGFPSQGQRCGVLIFRNLIKLLKQWGCHWFQMPWRSWDVTLGKKSISTLREECMKFIRWGD